MTTYDEASRQARPRYRHGNSPAAWITVALVLLAQVGCGVAVVLAEPVLFWVFVVAMVLAVALGKVLSMAGFGAMPTYTQTEPADSSLEGPDLGPGRGEQPPAGSRGA